MDRKVSGICHIVAFVLLLAGASSPGWLVFDVSGQTIHMGLFYVAGFDQAKSLGIGFLEFRAEVIIGIILCLIATIFTFVYGNGDSGHTHNFLIPPICMNLVAGILTWVACGRFIPIISRYSDLVDIGVPYSIIISGLGGILCFIGMVLLLIKRSRDSSVIQNNQNNSQGAVLGLPQQNVIYEHEQTKGQGIPPKSRVQYY